MAVVAKNDWDRLTDRVGTGNVITGANTVSGASGKDEGSGLVVTRVGHYLTIVSVGASGVDLAGTYGTLHINPNGTYSYTRTAANLWDANFPAFGKEDVFVYEIRDSSGATSLADLTIPILQQVNPSIDPVTGIHSGTEYDDYINVSSAAVKTDGGAGQDKINGTDSANYMVGGAGNDWLLGNGGNDTLEGGAGTDRLEGGAGVDVASYASAAAAVIVDLANAAANTGDAKGDTFISIERVEGSAFADSLSGDSNANRLIGGGGADKLNGRDANDYLEGGLGGDAIDGGAGANDVASYANSKAGVIVNLATNANSGGDAAGDTLKGIEVVYGSAFADKLTGDGALNILDAGDGNDSLDGGAGDDWLLGGKGDDWFKGGTGADVHTGGSNDYDIVSYEGDPAGDMVIWLPDTSQSTGWATGDSYFDIELIRTGAGNDTLLGDADSNGFDGGGGNDFLVGGDGSDHLIGGTGDDSLYGGSSIDIIRGGAGNDLIDGGDNHDFVFFDKATASVVVDLLNGSLNTGDAKGDTYLNVESYALTNFADKFYGTNAAEVARGLDGNDILSGRGGDDELNGENGADAVDGGAGADTVWGGAGGDTLTGGAGADEFSWLSSETGKDSLTDFKLGEDRLAFFGVLDGAGNDVQDLIDAGFTASTSGAALTIGWNNGASQIVIAGWTGGDINGIAALGQALGSDLIVG